MQITGLTLALVRQQLKCDLAPIAGMYEAPCGYFECQIDVSARGTSSPASFMPSGLVAQWAVGSSSDFNTGKAVAGGLGGATEGVIGGAILLGPIGALAGLVGGGIVGAELGDEFEGYFVVIGYNKKGEKHLTLFTLKMKSPSGGYSQSCR